MILSAPAPAALVVPLLSLATVPGSKGASETSQTNPFKDVLGSLTLFEDLESQGGAKQESETAPKEVTKEVTKKDRTTDSGSGAEALLLPQAPTRQVSTKLLLVPSRITAQAVEPHLEHQETAPREASNVAGSDEPSQALPVQSATTAQTVKAIEAISRMTPANVPTPEHILEVPSRAEFEGAQPAVALTSGTSVPTRPAAQPTVSLTDPRTIAAPKAAQLATSPVSPQTSASPQAVQSTISVTRPQSSASLSPTDRRAVAADAISKSWTATSVSRDTAPPPAQPVTDRSVSKASGQSQVSGSQAKSSPQKRSSDIDESLRKIPSKSDGIEVKALSAAAAPNNSTPVILKSASRSPGVIAPTPQHREQPRSELKTSPAPIFQSFTRAATERPGAAKPAPSQIVEGPVKDASPIVPAPRTTSILQPGKDIQPSEPAAKQMAATADASVPPAADTTSVATTSPLPNIEQKPEPASAPAELPQTTVTSSPVEASPAIPLPAQTQLPAIVPVSATVPAATTSREAAPSTEPAPQHEVVSAPAIPAPKIPLLPQAENFAFEVRMLDPEPSSGHTTAPQSKPLMNNFEAPATPATGPVIQSQGTSSQQTHTVQNQATSDSQRETVTSNFQAEKPASPAKNEAELAQPQKSDVSLHGSETSFFQTPQIESMASGLEVTEHTQTAPALASQEPHLLTPELPKSSAGSEMLLHLADGDQASAAIRVADRAGSLNVTVHASDPVLRESLRSNLSELTAQLNQQGWKAEIARTAVVAHSESQQDPHSGGQRGNPQQQFSGNDRQPQRDRRGNGQWRQELEQQISGGDAHARGNQ